MKFIVDGNNVCYWKEDRSFSFSLLLELLIQLKKRGDSFICFFDANIERILSEIDADQQKVKELLKNYIQYFKTVPAGNRADDYIIVTAHRYGASIVTNDRYENEQAKKYASKINWLSQKSQAQRLYKGQVLYFGEGFGNEWVLMLPDLGIEVTLDDNVNKKMDELMTLLNEPSDEVNSANQSVDKETESSEMYTSNIAEPEEIRKRYEGHVIVLAVDKGYGFVESPEFKENIYFKTSEVRNTDLLQVGAEISFEVSSNLKGTVAINICGLDEEYQQQERKKKPIAYITEVEKLNNVEYITPSIKVIGRVDIDKIGGRSKRPETVAAEVEPTENEPITANKTEPKKIILRSDESPRNEIFEKRPFFSERNLGDVASELNLNIYEVTSFLNKKGIHVYPSPFSKINYPQYTILIEEFGGEAASSSYQKKNGEHYSTTDIREWWNSISKQWQSIFCETLQINTMPTQKDLIRIVNLIYLDCNNRPVYNLEPLRRLTKLKVLICDNTQITSLEPLSNITTLEKINCSRNNIRSIEPMKFLFNLKYLYCDNTQIDTIEPLLNLKKLKVLDCGHNRLRYIDACKHMVNLKELWVYHTDVDDLEPLRNSPSLQELWCYNSKVETIEPLAENHDLKILDISNTRVSNADAVKYKDGHLKCEVYF